MISDVGAKVLPRRILFGVTTALSLRLLGDIPRSMADHGWEVHIVSSPGAEAELHDFSFASVHRIRMERKFNPWTDAIALFALIRLMVAIRPTIVSVGTPKAGFLGILASWITRVPRRVYVLRGLRLETLTGFSRVSFQLLEVFVGLMATHVLAVSLSLATKYAELPGAPREKLHILGAGASKGVDIRKFTLFSGKQSELKELKNLLGLDPHLPVVGYIGRISSDKGVYLLRDASNILYLAGVSHQVLIVGRSELDESVEDFVEGFLAPKVYLDHTEEVQEIFWVIDCFCLPTLREGFPNVLLEAAASGIPIITSDATGARDAVKSGVTGLLFKCGDSISLSDQLRLMLSGKVDAVGLTRNARKNVERKYTQEIVTENNVLFYISLLEHVRDS